MKTLLPEGNESASGWSFTLGMSKRHAKMGVHAILRSSPHCIRVSGAFACPDTPVSISIPQMLRLWEKSAFFRDAACEVVADSTDPAQPAWPWLNQTIYPQGVQTLVQALVLANLRRSEESLDRRVTSSAWSPWGLRTHAAEAESRRWGANGWLPKRYCGDMRKTRRRKHVAGSRNGSLRPGNSF